jgi:hypothetical protein
MYFYKMYHNVSKRINHFFENIMFGCIVNIFCNDKNMFRLNILILIEAV